MNIIATVRGLDLPKGTYAVFGSALLQQLDIRETNDIDIIVTSETFERLAASGEWSVGFAKGGDRRLVRDNIELYDAWNFGDYAPKVQTLIAQAEFIEDVPFVPLEEVLEWKRAAGGDKNSADVALIEDYLTSYQ